MSLPPGASLGASTDPKQLIHGDPGIVGSIGTYLQNEARTAASRFSDFDEATVRGWKGEAHNAYTKARMAQRGKLEEYADRFKRAANAFESYKGDLEEAQARAADAIAKYKEGEAASKAALDAYNASVDKYNSAVKRMNAHPGGAVPAVFLVPPGDFVDPGQALRDEAEKILELARQKLDQAGQKVISEYTISGVLGGSGGVSPFAGGSATGAVDISASGKVETGERKGEVKWLPKGEASSDDLNSQVGFDPTNIDEYGGNAGDDKSDEDGDGKTGKRPSIDADVTVAEAKASVSALHAEGEAKAHLGDVTAKAKGSVDLATAGVGAEAKIGKDGVELGANAQAQLVHAEGEASVDYGPIGAHAKGEAYVGGEAHASVGIGKDGVHAGGEAFVGAKVSADVGGDVGGVGAGVHAEAWAGAGVAADLDVGMKDGKFTIGGELGAGLGIGAKIGPSVTLDFPKMAETGKDIVEDAGKVVDQMTVTPDEAVDTGEKIVKGIGGLFS